MSSYMESNARERLSRLLDQDTLHEFLPPAERVVSPHLEQLDTPVAFDDGVVVARGLLHGQPVLAAAQEGGFIGGAVGEVHGAKLVGLLRRAIAERPAAVLLLLDTGGVRLHEANAGLIAVSEVMRAVLATRGAGVPVLALIGGANGCFGGMGIVACCANAVIMSEEGRLGLSGPEVIETAHGVEEYDARDRALVWRTTGGKHRTLTGDSRRLVADSTDAFREAAAEEMEACASAALSLEELEREHRMLAQRLEAAEGCRDPQDIWLRLGVAEPSAVPMLDAEAFRNMVAQLRTAAGAAA
jgi:malonate decarboxylase beta subunit